MTNALTPEQQARVDASVEYHKSRPVVWLSIVRNAPSMPLIVATFTNEDAAHDHGLLLMKWWPTAKAEVLKSEVHDTIAYLADPKT